MSAVARRRTGSQARVTCVVHGMREGLPPRHLAFTPGMDAWLDLARDTTLPRLSATALDLLDIALSVLWIERSLPGHFSSNSPARFESTFAVRKPDVWTPRAVSALAGLLQVLGNAEWMIRVSGTTRAQMTGIQGLGTASDHASSGDEAAGSPRIPRSPRRPGGISKVALLSGGLDSACGAVVLKAEGERVQLVSFYTRHLAIQRRIAAQLGYAPPVQFTRSFEAQAGRGRSFYYRSFLFLTLAAAVAEALGVRSLVQAENGILASAVPPADVWRMTLHAHPTMHEQFRRLLNELFKGTWEIDNPFATLTKRECVAKAQSTIGSGPFAELIDGTDTCWFHWSNLIRGGKKHPGQPCGVCIPCIVRRTALPDERVAFDLRKDPERNHKVRGRAFRSYATLLRELSSAKNTPAFYAALPPAAKELVLLDRMSLEDIERLFRAFAEEFFGALQVRRK